MDFDALIMWKTFIDICFSIKSLRIDSCLYEIPKNDLVDDMKLWPPITSPDVYCYLIETSGNFTGKKLKTYNFVISGWVKPLQVVKRNSGYDSHDATSPSSLPHPPSESLGYHDGKVVEFRVEPGRGPGRSPPEAEANVKLVYNC